MTWALTPCAVQCGGSVHRLAWESEGTIHRLDEHDDGERVLGALAATGPAFPCDVVAGDVATMARGVRELSSLLVQLLPLGPVPPPSCAHGHGAVGSGLVAGVDLGVGQRELRRSLLMERLPLSWRLRLLALQVENAVATPQAWASLGAEMRLDLESATSALIEASGLVQPGSVEVDLWHVAQIDSGRVLVSPTWLARVWARGHAVTDGQLVLDMVGDVARVAVGSARRPTRMEHRTL